jgi:hypothetical protein
MYLAVMTSVNAMAQLMIVDMDGLPMVPGSATALLFLASFNKPLAMTSLPRTNVSSRFYSTLF